MKRECLVRGNKVFFYGRLAELVQQSIKMSGLTPEKWLDKALHNYLNSTIFEKGLDYAKQRRKRQPVRNRG